MSLLKKSSCCRGQFFFTVVYWGLKVFKGPWLPLCHLLREGQLHSIAPLHVGKLGLPRFKFEFFSATSQWPWASGLIPSPSIPSGEKSQRSLSKDEVSGHPAIIVSFHCLVNVASIGCIWLFKCRLIWIHSKWHLFLRSMSPISSFQLPPLPSCHRELCRRALLNFDSQRRPKCRRLKWNP